MRQRSLFRLALKPNDSSILVPDFDIVAVDILLCCFDCLFVVLAVEAVGDLEAAVRADDISSIVDHETLPVLWAGAQLALSHRMPRAER